MNRKIMVVMLSAFILVSCPGDYFTNYVKVLNHDIKYQVRHKESITRSMPYRDHGVFTKRHKQSIDANRDKWIFISPEGCRIEYITDKDRRVLSGRMTSSEQACKAAYRERCLHCS